MQDFFFKLGLGLGVFKSHLLQLLLLFSELGVKDGRFLLPLATWSELGVMVVLEVKEQGIARGLLLVAGTRPWYTFR